MINKSITIHDSRISVVAGRAAFLNFFFWYWTITIGIVTLAKSWAEERIFHQCFQTSYHNRQMPNLRPPDPATLPNFAALHRARLVPRCVQAPVIMSDPYSSVVFKTACVLTGWLVDKLNADSITLTLSFIILRTLYQFLYFISALGLQRCFIHVKNHYWINRTWSRNRGKHSPNGNKGPGDYQILIPKNNFS